MGRQSEITPTSLRERLFMQGLPRLVFISSRNFRVWWKMVPERIGPQGNPSLESWREDPLPECVLGIATQTKKRGRTRLVRNSAVALARKLASYADGNACLPKTAAATAPFWVFADPKWPQVLGLRGPKLLQRLSYCNGWAVQPASARPYAPTRGLTAGVSIK